MSSTLLQSRVSILVKALPQPSKHHGETVCCAGVTEYGQLKRLYPVRFRHLSDASSFKRWDWVKFGYTKPTSDTRAESCRVMEDKIEVDGMLKRGEREKLLGSLTSPSAKHAADQGKSLALIRPQKPHFFYKKKSDIQLQRERETYRNAARQKSFLDKAIESLEPSPYEFRFKFEDQDGSHNYANGDWEAHAMFFNGRRRLGSEAAVLKWMDQTFNNDYPERGMMFCVGNMAKRPQTWQLLGVLRVDDGDQSSLL